MTKYTATSTVPWARREIRDLAILLSGAAVFWVLMVLSLNFLGGGWWVLFLIVAALFSLSGLYGLYLGFTRKAKAVQLAEMDTEGWKFQWWGKKPYKAVWGERLNPVYNRGDLTNIKTVTLIKVGKHEVFEFTDFTDRKFSLPLRLANTDGVRDFLLGWVEKYLEGRVPAVNVETMQALVNVMNRGIHENVEQPAVEDPAAVDPNADATDAVIALGRVSGDAEVAPEEAALPGTATTVGDEQ